MSDTQKKEAKRVVVAPVAPEVVAFAQQEVARVEDPYTSSGGREVPT